jgi:hypothetical protein
LYRALDGHARRPVTWISGPPGSGKTTLVAGYLAARQLRALWYQVDGRDADVGSLFAYLGRAAGRRFRHPAFTAEYRDGLPVFSRRFFERLYATLGARSVLVLDDYHEAGDSPAFHEALRAGLHEVPAGVRVLVTSRGAPPAQLARLRANGSLAALGWEDLRFNLTEVSALLRQRHGEAGGARALHERTEGWAAGLVLLQETGGAGESVGDGVEEVFAYFAGEILERTSPERRKFLLETAFLPGITPELARALTGNPAAERILADLARRQYFTERRDGGGPEYRYHALFRAFLQRRARAELRPARLRAVQREAARLLEAAGRSADAIELLRDAGDHEALMRVIVEQAPALFAEGRDGTVARWLEAVPARVREASGWLRYWQGMCALAGAPDTASRHFEAALERFTAAGDVSGQLLTWCGLVDAVFFAWSDAAHFDRCIAWLEERLAAGLAFPSPEIEGLVASRMTTAIYFRQLEHPDLAAWSARSLVLARASGNPDLLLYVLMYLNGFRCWMGDCRRARLEADEIGVLVDAPGVSPGRRPIAAMPRACVEIFFGEPAAAVEISRRAVEIAEYAGAGVWLPSVLANEAWGLILTGDLAAARAPLARHGAAATRPFDVWMGSLAGAILAIAERDLPALAEHAGRGAELARTIGVPFFEQMVALLQVNVLTARGRLAESLALLADADRAARAWGSAFLEQQCLTLGAHLACRQGRAAEGLELFERALTLGREHSLQNLFLCDPVALADLCALALDAGVAVDEARALVQRRRLVPSTPPLASAAWPWPLRVRTLGAFELERDGQPVRFPGKPPRAVLRLLKALIALGARDVPVAALADRMWPEADGDHAQQSLATALHRLRALLGDERALVLADGRLSLAPDRVWVDTLALPALLARATPRDDARARDLLSLYRGPFLAGEPDAAWAEPLRAQLARRFTAFTLARGAALEPAHARAWYVHALAAEPESADLRRALAALEASSPRRTARSR